jgi:hypothetical protein
MDLFVQTSCGGALRRSPLHEDTVGTFAIGIDALSCNDSRCKQLIGDALKGCVDAGRSVRQACSVSAPRFRMRCTPTADRCIHSSPHLRLESVFEPLQGFIRNERSACALRRRLRLHLTERRITLKLHSHNRAGWFVNGTGEHPPEAWRLRPASEVLAFNTLRLGLRSRRRLRRLYGAAGAQKQHCHESRKAFHLFPLLRRNFFHPRPSPANAPSPPKVFRNAGCRRLNCFPGRPFGLHFDARRLIRATFELCIFAEIRVRTFEV